MKRAVFERMRRSEKERRRECDDDNVCVWGGAILLTDELFAVGFVVLANLISIICFLHIQHKNYPDIVLCSKNKFGEGDWAGRLNDLPSVSCGVYLPPDDSSCLFH